MVRRNCGRTASLSVMYPAVSLLCFITAPGSEDSLLRILLCGATLLRLHTILQCGILQCDIICAVLLLKKLPLGGERQPFLLVGVPMLIL